MLNRLPVVSLMQICMPLYTQNLRMHAWKISPTRALCLRVPQALEVARTSGVKNVLIRLRMFLLGLLLLLPIAASRESGISHSLALTRIHLAGMD